VSTVVKILSVHDTQQDATHKEKNICLTEGNHKVIVKVTSPWVEVERVAEVFTARGL
jgi:hypothetical protein